MREAGIGPAAGQRAGGRSVLRHGSPPVPQPRDRWRSRAGHAALAEWLAQPPITAVMTVPVTARELTAAKALRQAIWDAAHAQAAHRPLPAEAIETINRSAAAAPLVPELAADGTTAGWAPPVRATQALSTLAREMIELLSGPLSGRIRECASDNCPLVFVDTSRPGARRWCAMERCGNRHKLHGASVSEA
ncbi:CGNR zinc finger domain-containing protein [Streptosporangium sandarakinum]